ncbi:hypothetical protein LCGC14_1189860 [marine sediment metagenome]
MLFFASTLFAQDWQPSYADAVTEAQKQDKPILLVFAGSDWCAPCIKLDKTIWQSEEFSTYAAMNLILYRADFPRKKANQLSTALADKNNTLAEKFNPDGHFPLVLVLDANEKILGETGYLNSTPKAYIEHINSFIK